tara:strand:- start:453 stop:806 length:354 start_codon:yes stop_codon:yes gene_type:complete
MRKKIRLTERNLQGIVNRVIKESQLLTENLIEVECECGEGAACTGSYDGETMNCTCCAAEIDMVDGGGRTKGGMMGGMMGGTKPGGRTPGDKIDIASMMGENRRLKLENRKLRRPRR